MPNMQPVKVYILMFPDSNVTFLTPGMVFLIAWPVTATVFFFHDRINMNPARMLHVAQSVGT